MSISARQKQLVQSSFSQVEPIADKAAEIFYAKLFEYDPPLKSLFKGDMKQQGRMLMNTLAVAVKSLNDLDTLVPVLQNLAVKHVDYGVSVDDYTPVGNALMHTLKTGLGAGFDRETKEAWMAVYKTVATVMRQAAYPDYRPDSYKNNKRYRH